MQAPAEVELAGHRALVDARIPTAELVAWGVLRDRRSFVIFDDLRGFDAADKLVAGGLPFARILEPAADLAAALHSANLHHRDLYLCHMFARVKATEVELRLIDAAHMRKLPALTRARWIAKDLAQFWYSTLALPVTDQSAVQWLERYAVATRHRADHSLAPRNRAKSEMDRPPRRIAAASSAPS